MSYYLAAHHQYHHQEENQRSSRCQNDQKEVGQSMVHLNSLPSRLFE